jgi:hypothetical protein
MKLNGATYNFTFMGLNGVSVLRFSIAGISVKPFFKETIQARVYCAYLIIERAASVKGAVLSIRNIILSYSLG